MQTNGRFYHVRFVIALIPVSYLFSDNFFVGEMMGLCDVVLERCVKGGF